MVTDKKKNVDPSKQLVSQMVDKYGVRTTMKALALQVGYKDLPPTIEEFVDGDNFLKEALWDDWEDKSLLYPVWRSALKELYPNPIYSPYEEVIATGSIGGGKTWFCKIGMLYDILKMSYLKSPQFYYGLGRTTRILYAVYSETLRSARGALFDELVEWINICPALKAFTTDKGKTVFQSYIDVREGSRFSHTIGQAVGGAILSELNFQSKVSNQAYQNYTSNKRRMTSRFPKGIPGHMWLDSSKKGEGAAFLEDRIKNVRGDPSVRILDHAIWETQPHKYPSETFKMFVGDENRDPFVIDSPRDTLGLDDARIIDVPINLYKAFKDDPYNALQDLAGHSVSSVHKFIASREKLTEAFVRPNPVKKEVIYLDFYDERDSLIKYIDIERLKHKNTPKFAHIDLGLGKGDGISKGDSTGLAMSSVFGFVTVQRTNPINFEEQVIKEPVIGTDFVFALRARASEGVPIYKIKNFIRDLKKLGINVVYVSADGYQSENIKQDMLRMGLGSEIVSVDKTRSPYDNFKQLILEGRWSGVKHSVLQTELKELLDLTAKVDHPAVFENGEKGSKDCADAVVGSIWGAYNNINKFYGNVTGQDEVIAEMKKEMEGRDVYDSIFRSASFMIPKT